MVDPARDFLFVPEQPEKSAATYEEYVARHMVSPREREGQLGNMDEICTAAAYMLAAHEQKDSADFDEKEADLRAMEISGSKAFRAYMQSHPGSLLAAARNTGIEATHREMTALDVSLTKRDGVLASVRDAMRRNASGNTAGYHKLMNALDRFGSSAEEPPEQVRNELSLKLAQYVMTEGNPANINYQKENCDMAARALKALLPKKDFDAFLTTANQNRAPGQKLRAEELEGPMPNAPEEKKPRKGRRSARQEEAEKAPEQQAGVEHNGEPYAEEYGEYDGQYDEQYEEQYDEEYSEQPNDEYAG